jgi:predicted RNA-binding Zn-ribbon protein involved in translation (DUF1610 family)
MLMEEKQPGALDKKLAAVCGLFCPACSLFIATTEDPAKLKGLAKRFELPEETIKCYGCRSDKRGPYCQTCKMSACSAERGIDFCVQCPDYPCEELKQFQSAMPHRIELWDDLERIKAVGYEEWLKEKRAHYGCPQCGSLNSTYDLKCRKCGRESSCDYVAEHRKEIEDFLSKR